MLDKLWSFYVAFLACYGFYALFIERAWMEGEGPDGYFAAQISLVALTALVFTISAHRRSKRRPGDATQPDAMQRERE